MKNKFLKLMVIVAMLFAGSALMTACTPDNGDDYNGPPVLEVGKPNVISAVKVDIPINAKKLQNIIYKIEVVGADEEFKTTPPATAKAILFGGKKVAGNLQVLHLTGNDGLSRSKRVVVYIGGIISATELYGEDPSKGDVFTVEFKTPDNWADEDVIIQSTSSEGAEVVVQIPEKVKQAGHRVKWGITNIATINYWGKAPIPEKLHSNDVMYPACLFKNDTVLQINHHNAYRRGPNGEIGYYYFVGYNADGTMREGVTYDPEDSMVESGEAEATQYYPICQPGEPLVLMMSEVAYTDCTESNSLEGSDYTNHMTTCDKKHTMIDWGWGPGYYWYPYDYEAYVNEAGGGREPGELPDMGVGGGNNNEPTIDFNKFWHEGAWYKSIEITLPGPEKFVTGSVNINATNLKPDGGKIYFTPTGDTFAYFMGIYPDSDDNGGGYYDLIAQLDNKPQHLQWLTTAEIAPYMGIFPYYASEGTVVLDMENDLQTVTANMKYHIIVNAVPGKMVDGDLAIDVSKQAYQHFEFTLPNYTLPEPELTVTPCEAFSPYKVKFNIKNPNYATLPVKKVVYAANYTREFSSYMDYYNYSYADLVMMNDGYANLTSAEVEQVNSDFGFDIEFDVRENSHFTLAVMGWNNESRPSDPDKEGSKAIAEAQSVRMEKADSLNMDKLNALKGDWTATATVKTYDLDKGVIVSTENKSWKVTIGDLKTDHVLTDEEYKIFEDAKVSKEVADEYLAEFNQQAAYFNEAVLGQNRVLCQGWDITGERKTSTASPWDLFLMPDYSASLVDYLFYDFGPKWFLQTDAQGNIFVPVNKDVVPQVMSWYDGMERYLCSGNFLKGIANYKKSEEAKDAFDVQSVGIPVEISADGNTVTLKSVVVNATIDEVAQDVTLYPTLIYDNQGQLAFQNPYVDSEVVLTRGWNGAATPAPTTTKLSKGKVGFGKTVVNSEGFKSNVKPHSRTVFAPSKSLNAIKNATPAKKIPSKAELNAGFDKYMQRFNRYAYRK